MDDIRRNIVVVLVLSFLIQAPAFADFLHAGGSGSTQSYCEELNSSFSSRWSEFILNEIITPITLATHGDGWQVNSEGYDNETTIPEIRDLISSLHSIRMCVQLGYLDASAVVDNSIFFLDGDGRYNLEGLELIDAMLNDLRLLLEYVEKDLLKKLEFVTGIKDGVNNGDLIISSVFMEVIERLIEYHGPEIKPVTVRLSEEAKRWLIEDGANAFNKGLEEHWEVQRTYPSRDDFDNPRDHFAEHEWIHGTVEPSDTDSSTDTSPDYRDQSTNYVDPAADYASSQTYDYGSTTVDSGSDIYGSSSSSYGSGYDQPSMEFVPTY